METMVMTENHRGNNSDDWQLAQATFKVKCRFNMESCDDWKYS